MLAIPLDDENSTTLSKLYGKAPFFALLSTETGSVSVIENKVKGDGPKSGGFLKENGVDATIFFHMGEGVYKGFVELGMDVYTAKTTKYSIDGIYTEFLKDFFTKLDDGNYKELLIPGDPGETCKCGCSS